MDSAAIISLAASKHGWSLLGEPVDEGLALRQLVVANEQTALLYAYRDAESAERVAWCHHVENAAQLFVVPELIASGERWCLLQGIRGAPLQDWLKKNGLDFTRHRDSSILLQELGEIVRKLHSTKPGIKSYGDVLEKGSHWLTFNGYVASRCEEYAEEVRTLGLDDELASKVANAIGEIRHELASFHPRSHTTLCHGRLALEHVWVAESGRDVVGLTGFENAQAMPPELDLAWLLWMEGVIQDDEATRALYRGYGAARTMDVQRREHFYMRLVALDALYGRLGRVPKKVEELVALITE